MASCDPVGQAIERCPFLTRVSSQQGEAFARRFVANPILPAAAPPIQGRRPVFEEDDLSIDSVARIFHGPGGLVPLARFSGATPQAPCSRRSTSTAAAARNLGKAWGLVREGPQEPARLASQSLASAAGSITLSSRFPSGSGGDGIRPGPNGRGRQSSGPNPPNAGSGASGAPVGGSGGRCPLRGMLGPIGGLISLAPKMKCPAPICAVRAAIARTKAVRHLRPQALPVKFAAVGAFTAAVNVPCGAWRETFEKFSPGWFVAVHLTIPVVGMLRKAVMMPPYALVLTIAAAIAGQQIGAKVERYRRSRHVAFTTYNPKLVYNGCPVLPPLSETPSNPNFALEVQAGHIAWEKGSAIAKPVLLGLAGAKASADVFKLSPLCLAAPVEAF
mmetsp:Transcript_4705/g.13054  ORF Transcript_4705/g.13054 Transcript_4705/m.13054 type:complete len:388 (+) Transcript_4705:169-1332(+)|eukprot:CAMPEP_0117668808 /NCGR_PEP_ID=MMETSP0804-20121206/11764_1 /TAXON_ID=1074897 /ORGANISM="Tetraselmis astigmatica, Strain CCMP880" /LENGTH=387 /DNA_ID=CAMNT_0005476759 /DNA_START=159 /DNA_END=1322 /DNA_ORIENTATION=-